MAFAITNGNFGSASTWDTGVVPSGSDDVYANGFTIQVDGTFSVNTIRNDMHSTGKYIVPNIATPPMTSNNSPSGIVSASQNNINAFVLFDRNLTTQFTANVSTPVSIIYQFPTGLGIVLKRYVIRGGGSSNLNPFSWTIAGSNDGINWSPNLDSISGNIISANSYFASTVLSNTTNYTYYRLTITAVGSGTALSFAELELSSSTAVLGITIGGTFNLTNNSNLTCTATTGIVDGVTSGVVTYSLPSGNTATLNTSIASFNRTSSTLILFTSTGTLNTVGNWVSGAAAGKILLISGGGTLNHTGSLLAISTGISPVIDIISVGAVLNITGDQIAGSTYTIKQRIASNITITGNLTNNGSAPLLELVGGSLTVIGNVTSTSTSTASCIQNITTATLMDINGVVTAGTGANAIAGLGLVKLSGLAINNNRYQAIYAPQVTIELTTTSWKYQQFAGADLTLYASGASLGNPNTFDVRNGITYGPSGTLTGTLRVPNPNVVLLGNLTDNTTGTLLMTPADFITELNTSTASVAVRLQNCATVATTGDQVASYGV